MTDLERADGFYETLLGRPPRLRQRAIIEWRLHPNPEVTLRIVEDPSRAGTGRIGLAVDDLPATLAVLADRGVQTLPATTKAGVITFAELRDPDGNTIVVWQDLLDSGATAF